MSGNSHQRRLFRRRLLLAGVFTTPKPPPFVAGEKVRLTSDQYGKSYAGSLVEVLSLDGNTVSVQHRKRKSPLVVELDHLSKVA